MPLAVVARARGWFRRETLPCAASDAAVAVSACDVGDRAAVHHRLRHAALLRAAPDRRVARAPLAVGVEPARDFRQFLHALDRPTAVRRQKPSLMPKE